MATLGVFDTANLNGGQKLAVKYFTRSPTESHWYCTVSFPNNTLPNPHPTLQKPA